MKSIILISGAVIFLMILFFAMGYLKKLRKAFDHADVKNFSGTDAERIVNAYRTEEGYLKRRTRVWLLTIALEAAVVLTTFGSVYYLANKDRWAAERELAQAQKEQKRLEAEKRKEQERLEAEKRKKQECSEPKTEREQAEAEGLSLWLFRYKQKEIRKAQDEADRLLAALQRIRKTAAADKDRFSKNSLSQEGNNILTAYADRAVVEVEKKLVAAEKNVIYLKSQPAEYWKSQWADRNIPFIALLLYVGLIMFVPGLVKLLTFDKRWDHPSRRRTGLILLVAGSVMLAAMILLSIMTCV